MPTNGTDIKYLVIIGIAVMLLLFTSFLVALIFIQRKKLKYQRSMEILREQQQNQLIEAAVRSEEQERHRIAETLHDEVGAILSSAKLSAGDARLSVSGKLEESLFDGGTFGNHRPNFGSQRGTTQSEDFGGSRLHSVRDLHRLADE